MEVASRNIVKQLPYGARVQWIEAPVLAGRNFSYAWIDTEIVPISNKTSYSATFWLPPNVSLTDREVIGVIDWSLYALSLSFAGDKFIWHGVREEFFAILIGHKYHIDVSAESKTVELIDITDGRRKLVENANMQYNLTKLFCIPGGRGDFTTPMRIFDFKMSIDGELVSDMVPVRVKDEGGMYDRVRDRVFLTAGSQKLNAGPELWEGED